jgi:hypothetical protein
MKQPIDEIEHLRISLFLFGRKRQNAEFKCMMRMRAAKATLTIRGRKK